MTIVKTISASSICGTEVENLQDEDIGKIEDVMINWNTGEVQYLVLSYGGIFGTTLADKRFAVPFSAFSIKCDDDEIEYQLNVSKERLEEAPGFDKDNYPSFADSQFTSGLHSFYTDTKKAA